jgi:hypothetical protein
MKQPIEEALAKGGRMSTPIRSALLAAVFLAALHLAEPSALQADEPVAPFGIGIGAFSYDDTLKLLKTRDWPFEEYEKKQFKTVAPDAAERGRNTFLRVSPRQLNGVKGLLIFFDPERRVQAVLVNLEPGLFDPTMAQLDDKYRLVRKKLQGESFTSDHPYVLYEKDDVYVELQMYSPHRVRLLYTKKFMWENYREFLQKDYEPFRSRQNREAWMKDL